ncbi:MAG: acyl-CoA ligase (AMP-forming), exosortase A system-associated [Gammaproteobacteria bacterium]
MSELLFELPLRSAERASHAPSLVFKGKTLDYGTLGLGIERFGTALMQLGLGRLERVAIYLPKQPEAVVAIFGTARAGCVFVPVNPLLKPVQVGYVLRDCNVRVLVTSPERAQDLGEVLPHCPDLQHLIVTDNFSPRPRPDRLAVHAWDSLLRAADARQMHRVIDADVVAIFYTSGSTGKPKGVVLSHKNMVTGAHSVARYLGNVPQDRLLAALPLSFDYGFSQLSTAFHVGASVVLMDYLFARDVLTIASREHVTGLAGVPSLWAQLVNVEWPTEVARRLRYITNSGGAMPRATLQKLRSTLPDTQVFLMYGLTEAFRSTYLPPSEVDRRPDSIGKAIPSAEIIVVRPDGTRCGPNEPGELVHRGSLVALGYWNDLEKTAERFKPVPGQDPNLVLKEMAVWSGDTVRMDAEGYLYFIGRRDEMIKTSGYRVSPTEVEEIVFDTGLVADVAAVGVPHPALGQAIVIVATPVRGATVDKDELLAACRRQLPAFMVPHHVEWRDELPRNPNGKYDRTKLAEELRALYAEGVA